MDWYQSIFELIDMRSFSNLWFWIVLAVLWSSVSHRGLGIPWDMVTRARSGTNAQSREDLHDLVRINCNRIVFITEETGLLVTGFMCFILTALALLGFVYDNEFSQAVFLMAFPLSMVGILTAHNAKTIKTLSLKDEALYKQLYRHRVVTQVIGMGSVVATVFWGMAKNMTAGALGG